MANKANLFLIIGIVVVAGILLWIIFQNNSSDGFSITPGSNKVITEHYGGDALWVRESIDELERNATDVMRAEVLDSRVEMICMLAYAPSKELEERFTKPHTVYSLKVLEVFKGNKMTGDVVEIMQAGGKIGNRKLINDRMVPLSSGDDLFFFLRNYEKLGPEHPPMALEAGIQSVFRIASTDKNKFADGIEAAFLANPSLSDIAFENFDYDFNPKPLTLTVGDLMRIKAQIEDNNSEDHDD